MRERNHICIQGRGGSRYSLAGQYSNCAVICGEAGADAGATEDAAAKISCRNSKWDGSAVGNACNERTGRKDIAATDLVGSESIKLEHCAAVEVGEDSPGLEGSTLGSVEEAATEFVGAKLDRLNDCTLGADCRLSFRSAIAICR